MKNKDDKIKLISYYLRIALQQRACLKHPISAVIENVSKNKYILGWNGPVYKDLKEHFCKRKEYSSGEGIEYCDGIHAEMRAISRAAKEGISTEGATLYLSEWFPCSNCAKSIVEAGIERIVTPDEFYEKGTKKLLKNLRDKKYNFELALEILNDCNIGIYVCKGLKWKKD